MQTISSWIFLIKSEIVITTGMVWPLSSDKWKAPLGPRMRLCWYRSTHCVYQLTWRPSLSVRSSQTVKQSSGVDKKHSEPYIF